MAYSPITYADKVENNGATPAGRFGADDLNEIKTVTNANGADFDGRIDALETGADVSQSTVVSAGSTEARKLADRFADTVNVKDFGAVGDGVADDYVAIQAALDAGGSIIFPAGTYLVGTQIRIGSNSTLDLTSSAVIQRGFNTSGSGDGLAGITTGSTNVKILGGTFDANGTVYGTGSGNALSGLTLSNVEIKGTTFLDVVDYHAIDFGDATNILITDCKFYGTNNTCIRALEVHNMIISNNIMRGASTVINLQDVTDINITGNSIKDVSGTGIYLTESVRRVSITGNIMHDLDGRAVHVTGTGAADRSDITISGNQISDCAGDSFIACDSGASSNILISNNHLSVGTLAKAPTGSYYIYVSATGANRQVFDNFVDDAIAATASILNSGGSTRSMTGAAGSRAKITPRRAANLRRRRCLCSGKRGCRTSFIRQQ